MSFWTRNKRPVPEDYITEEQYEEALWFYEDAENDAIDEAVERDYEERYGG